MDVLCGCSGKDKKKKKKGDDQPTGSTPLLRHGNDERTEIRNGVSEVSIQGTGRGVSPAGVETSSVGVQSDDEVWVQRLGQGQGQGAMGGGEGFDRSGVVAMEVEREFRATDRFDTSVEIRQATGMQTHPREQVDHFLMTLQDSLLKTYLGT